ncbi:hypothetical protein [Rhizobium hainanense]|uniref:hypothetical protein n=1 Tax=Rhizobium hainanense TaxID=52131 RepID=UPI00096A6D46|nr:hypothetical protein [Rhizobium hainanense]
MDELYLSVNLADNRTIFLAPLTQRQIDASGDEVDDDSGYFLFERIGSGEAASINILARLASDEAVERLRHVLGLS